MFLESFLASITFSIETISPNRRELIFLAEDGGGDDGDGSRVYEIFILRRTQKIHHQ